MTPDRIKLHNIRQARRRRDRADASLRESIADARAAGLTLQAIADAAGVSRQRIHELTKGE